LKAPGVGIRAAHASKTAHPSKTAKDRAPSMGMVQTRINFEGRVTRLVITQNDPGYPGSSRTWCSSLSISVLAVMEAMSSYLGRLSLRSLPGIDLLHRTENGPGGIRTRIRALTESCAAVAPRALCGVSRAARIVARMRVTTVLVGFKSGRLDRKPKIR
jgi:hypothetical protein